MGILACLFDVDAGGRQRRQARGEETKNPTNVVLRRLLPCTPDLQHPIETLWRLVREAVANRGFHDIGHLKNIVRRRCDYLAQNPDLVRSRIGFDWVLNI